jgi:hypothetical protein
LRVHTSGAAKKATVLPLPRDGPGRGPAGLTVVVDQTFSSRGAGRRSRASGDGVGHGAEPVSDLAAAGGVSALGGRSHAGDIDVPTAVIVSVRDRLIGAARQRELARSIPGACPIEIDVAHNGWMVAPDIICTTWRPPSTR